MNWDTWLPVLVVASSLLPGLVIFFLREGSHRLRTTLNLVGAGLKLVLVGRLADGRLMRARVTGDRDPGYGSTSKMLSESAVCLAMDEPSCNGGLWTPASAMADALLGRLVENAGLTFELI